MLTGKRILLIVGGGIAAYRGLELIRALRRRGAAVSPVLTSAAQQFVTPLSASALAAERVWTDLFSLTDEAEMGHIELSRAADLLVVAPCTADLMGKMAAGLADDLASTLLMATDKRVLIAPAMNVRMWSHPATRRNLATLRGDGVLLAGPDDGEMACGEFGPGRMAQPEAIADAIEAALQPEAEPGAEPPVPVAPLTGRGGAGAPRPGEAPAAGAPPHEASPHQPPPREAPPAGAGAAGAPAADGLRGRAAAMQALPAGARQADTAPAFPPSPDARAGAPLAGAAEAGPLAGRHVLVTSGPTHEPIDPVRYIANRSSGAQGAAIARALAELGARVSFVTGPAEVPPPEGVAVIRVETAREMLAAVQAALPAEAAVFAAAVADWQVDNAAGRKLKKDGSGRPPALHLRENPDILATVARMAAGRPALVVGFAAETERVVEHATAKRLRKGCDWIVANDVSPGSGVMGGAENAVTVIDAQGAESWPRLPKAEVARRLAQRIADALRSGR